MSVLDGFEAVGEKTTTNKMTMTVMESSVRFSKGVTEALGWVVPEKLRTLDHGRPWSDDQFASTRLSSNRDMSR